MALIINGETIDDEVIEEEFRHIKGQYERALQVACCERDDEFRNMAKDNLSSRALLQQEAQRRYPEVSAEDVTDRLTKLMEQAGGEDAFYVNIGMPFKDETIVREQVANGVRLDKLLQSVYAPEPEFTDEQLGEYYGANVKNYLMEEELHAAHVSINPVGAQHRDDVYQLMIELRDQALNGADFEALGRDHNSNKEQSPDLGWFKRGEFMEEFEVIAFSMKTGEVSPVFVTQLGYHMVKVLDRKPAVPKPFEEVKEEVRRQMLEEHRDRKFNQFVDDLKEGAEIRDTELEAREEK